MVGPFKYIFSALVTWILTGFSAFGQLDRLSEYLSLSQMEFDSWYGALKGDTTDHYYCLLGFAETLTPSAENTDSLIAGWIKEHPQADVIPVYTYGPVFPSEPHSLQTYCWLVDGRDTLNIYLVREGALPALTMRRPETWEEMTEAQRKLHGRKPIERVHVTDEVFFTFYDKALAAMNEAQKEQKGIHAD